VLQEVRVERGRLRYKRTNAVYRVEIEREEDGRWIADVVDLPGVMAYGDTKESAINRVSVLARRVLEERAGHRELTSARQLSPLEV
jgi:predicted RNase H-like HicB family nuclease